MLALGVWFMAPFIATVGAGLVLLGFAPLERWRGPINAVWLIVLGSIALINASLSDSRAWSIAGIAAGLLLISPGAFIAIALMRKRRAEDQGRTVRSGH